MLDQNQSWSVMVHMRYIVYNPPPALHRGEMDEWFKSPPWKGGTGATLSRVRIPLSPPDD